MTSSMNTRLVKSSSASPKPNVAQVKSAQKAVATPNTGTRFLGFLMSVLGAPAF